MIDPLSIPSIATTLHESSSPPLPTRRLLAPCSSHPDDYSLSIDNSTLEKFTICCRKAELYSVFSREAVYDQSAQSFGRLFHLCEELRLRHGLSDAVITKQREMVASHFLLHHVSPDDHRSADRMLQVLKVYNERYAMDGWPDKVMQLPSTVHGVHCETTKAVEIGFQLPLCTIPVDAEIPYSVAKLVTNQSTEINEDKYGFNPLPIRNLHIYWTGRIDAIIHDPPYTWVVDHKTSKEGGKDFTEAFRLASQMMGYSWAAEQLLGHPVTGCIVNALVIRPPAKTARATLPREEFDRLPYFYRPDQLLEWRRSVQHTIADFVSCLVRGYFPMTGPKSFRSPCVYCDYHENCKLPPSQRAADLACKNYRDVTWNPLSAE